jgi:hypothetical protein
LNGREFQGFAAKKDQLRTWCQAGDKIQIVGPMTLHLKGTP